MQKFIITFDEFFKRMAKLFFEALNFHVQTEVEIFKLPKKLDVLVIEQTGISEKEELKTFDFWKQYNILSYVGLGNRIRIADFSSANIYFHGFCNMEKKANWDNTTVTLILPYKPEKILKSFKNKITPIAAGKYYIDQGFFNLYIIDLSEIEINGADGQFLSNYGPEDRLQEPLQNLKKIRFSKKIIDALWETLYIRYTKSDRLQELGNNMASATIDITDLVKPQVEKMLVDRERESKLETARRMVKDGLPLDAVCRYTGLTQKQLREAKLI